ncbi:hypothetical protein BDD12DRAFT_859025 [Trichophaea hybrida]|nr:hypothetical protein BDD12DRAFT_859025 [Trichophaea hybrida]
MLDPAATGAGACATSGVPGTTAGETTSREMPPVTTSGAATTSGVPRTTSGETISGELPVTAAPPMEPPTWSWPSAI